MAMTQADAALVRELTTLLVEFAVRAEREHPTIGPRDDKLSELLARADRALWDSYMRLEPLC